MKTVLLRSVLMVFLVPVSAPAQDFSLTALLGADSREYCRQSWSSTVETDSRLYAACLQEQQGAETALRSLHGRYATQGFYRDIALPFCRNAQEAVVSLNLVQLQFCLEDELHGYQELQDLRRRYGSSRVDRETRQALAESGSWAAAAGLVKRSTNLKTIRRGSES